MVRQWTKARNWDKENGLRPKRPGRNAHFGKYPGFETENYPTQRELSGKGNLFHQVPV